MQEANLQPNVASYSSVINACAQKGDVEKAQQWFNWMEKANGQPDVTRYSSEYPLSCVDQGEIKKGAGGQASAGRERANVADNYLDVQKI